MLTEIAQGAVTERVMRQANYRNVYFAVEWHYKWSCLVYRDKGTPPLPKKGKRVQFYCYKTAPLP